MECWKDIKGYEGFSNKQWKNSYEIWIGEMPNIVKSKNVNWI